MNNMPRKIKHSSLPPTDRKGAYARLRSRSARVAPPWVHRVYGQWRVILSRGSEELQQFLEGALEHVSGSTAIVTEYAALPGARWGWGAPPHLELARLLNESAGECRELLQRFEVHLPALGRICSVSEDPDGGFWDNPYFENLDGIALYGLLAEREPARFVEIGSGYSTRIARRAITDAGLETRLVSIDPHPRVEVEELCDEVYRMPMQDAPRELFDELQMGDVLLVDGTHMVHMNSDATIVFTEVLPRLGRGVLVGIDDIFLPWDYPPEWKRRWYGEQYLLAVSLLSGSPSWRAVFAAWWVSHDEASASALTPFASRLPLKNPMLGKTWWMERAA